MTYDYRSITEYQQVFGKPETVTYGAYFQDTPLSIQD